MQKVLLIEDDETMLSLLTTLLQLEGYEAARFKREESLKETLDRVREERPSLVYLDIHLRNFNGLDLLRELRQDEALKTTRVLMSSGTDLGSECLRAGADGFILKPYMPDNLIQEMRSIIGT
jgi:DNA-binding response OmpR family regulator